LPPSTKLLAKETTKESEIVRIVPQKEFKRYANFNYLRRTNLKSIDV